MKAAFSPELNSVVCQHDRRRFGLRRGWHALAARLAAWRHDRRRRIVLASLDARTLRDIGLAAEELERALIRPRWQM